MAHEITTITIICNNARTLYRVFSSKLCEQKMIKERIPQIVTYIMIDFIISTEPITSAIVSYNISKPKRKKTHPNNAFRIYKGLFFDIALAISPLKKLNPISTVKLRTILYKF